MVTDETHGEIVTVYTERSTVPNSLWLTLLQTAQTNVDILVYAGLHLRRLTQPGLRRSSTNARNPFPCASHLGTLNPSRCGHAAKKKVSAPAWPPYQLRLCPAQANPRHTKPVGRISLNGAV